MNNLSLSSTSSTIQNNLLKIQVSALPRAVMHYLSIQSFYPLFMQAATKRKRRGDVKVLMEMRGQRGTIRALAGKC